MAPIDIDIERLTYLFNPRASLSGLREVWNISPKSRRVAYVVFWVFGVQPCIPFAHETHNCHGTDVTFLRLAPCECLPGDGFYLSAAWVTFVQDMSA